MRISIPIRTLLFFSILFAFLNAHAQFYIPPAASAMGGSGRAGNNASESFFLNPATLSQLKSYYGGVDYDWGTHPREGYSSDIAAFLDDGSADKAFPGQFSYVQRKISPPGGTSATLQDFQLGLAYATNSMFGMGLSIHRELYDDSSGKSYAQNNFTLGTILQPMEQLALAFVAYDILGGDSSVPQAYQTIPTLAIGGKFSYKTFSVDADLVRPDKFNDGNKLNTSLGIETFFAEYFAFRAGWEWREAGFEEKLFSVGVGYKGPRLCFDYSFQKDTLAGFGYRQFVDLWLHF